MPMNLHGPISFYTDAADDITLVHSILQEMLPRMGIKCDYDLPGRHPLATGNKLLPDILCNGRRAIKAK